MNITRTTQPTPEKITAAELRAELESLHNQLDTLTNAVNVIAYGIQHAATATPPTPSGQFKEMEINNIIMSYDDNGKKVYKAKGKPFPKHGVRIWDEVLPMLGIDAALLQAGPNPQSPPILARVLMHDYKDDNGEIKTAPKKVTGKA